MEETPKFSMKVVILIKTLDWLKISGKNNFWIHTTKKEYLLNELTMKQFNNVWLMVESVVPCLRMGLESPILV